MVDKDLQREDSKASGYNVHTPSKSVAKMWKQNFKAGKENPNLLITGKRLMAKFNKIIYFFSPNDGRTSQCKSQDKNIYFNSWNKKVIYPNKSNNLNYNFFSEELVVNTKKFKNMRIEETVVLS